jgi:DNA-binding PadR family transcriptional regulator
VNNDLLITFMEPSKRYTVDAMAPAFSADHSEVIFALERLKRFGFVRESENEEGNATYSLTTAGVRLREIIITRT